MAINTPYLTGFNVKPSTISIIGYVSFTDGTNEVTPNQLQCEAYGYTYNEAEGTCSAFRYNSNLNIAVANENNKTFGAGNTTEVGTNNTIIMGESNTVRGSSRNSIVTGSQNEIVYGINNASVSGTLGEVTADNSTVLGGNAFDDALGKRQKVTVLFGRQTSTSGNKASYMNNTTNSYFPVPENAILFFHAYVVAIRVGGVSLTGGTGDYASWVERGVVINKSGTLSIQRERDAIKSSGGVSGWQPTAAVLGTDFYVKVKGANLMTIEWALTVSFTQIKTGVTL